jgi:hypothetical protein
MMQLLTSSITILLINAATAIESQPLAVTTDTSFVTSQKVERELAPWYETNCFDSELRIGFKPEKENKKKFRSCETIDRSDCSTVGIADSCPSICGACNLCEDSPFKFKVKGRKRKWDCNFVKKNAEKRCTKPGVMHLCRRTCNVCNDLTVKCLEKFPKVDTDKLGDGTCDGFGYNTRRCGFDGGDCEEFNKKYPKGCYMTDPLKVGDGQCDGGAYNTKACDFDGGDCEFYNQFPNCKADHPSSIGNGICEYWNNMEECGFDGGDCELYNSFPECEVRYAMAIGDGSCMNAPPYNTAACGFDGGDCVAFNKEFPGCKGFPHLINDGECLRDNNTPECKYDNGDCDDFNKNYPDCDSRFPDEVGDGICTLSNNSPECGYDGGDCDLYNSMPQCDVSQPRYLGNGYCNLSFNTVECGYDGGDCTDFNEKYPKCKARFPSDVGNGDCDVEYNTSDCGFDGGDCLE